MLNGKTRAKNWMAHLLEDIFGELGIAQYLDAFLEQGFDTWETILDITESDLDALGVKLGHRRKLQRRIANTRGIAPDASLVSPAQPAHEDIKTQDVIKTELPEFEAREAVALVITKRKYRRHPKPDENAPERPPSAYVLFSNKMREELKGRNLSFTEIAKLVGENWQNLTAVEKEPFESQAQAIKDKYLSDIAEYKQTPEYRKYQAYLHDFRAKHASSSQDKDASKRVRLSESGGQRRGSPNATTRTSRSGSGAESGGGSEPPTSRPRVGSVLSTSESQYTSSLPPSTTITSPEESVRSPTLSDAGRQFSDISPTFSPDSRDQPSFPAPRHSSQGESFSSERPSMHRHLPSLSDVFDAQGFPSGMRPSSEASGFRFSGPHVGSPRRLSQSNNDARPALFTNGHTYGGNPPSHGTFGHPRPQVDGPLPIHAMLASKQEPSFHHNQQPSHLHHVDPYHTDHKPRHMHQMPNGGPGLPMINGYHHNHQHHNTSPPSHPHPHEPPMNGSHTSHEFRPPSKRNAPSPPPPLHERGGEQAANLDGMSALLKAGELVGRH